MPLQNGLIDLYIQALMVECRSYQGLSFDTLYLGGGTPSLLGPDNLIRLIDGLRHAFDLSNLVEATIEVNPESATVSLLEAAKSSGINRISIGVQSLSQQELEIRFPLSFRGGINILIDLKLAFRSDHDDGVVLEEYFYARVRLGFDHIALKNRASFFQDGGFGLASVHHQRVSFRLDGFSDNGGTHSGPGQPGRKQDQKGDQDDISGCPLH